MGKAASLREICTADQCFDESGDLRRIGGAVRVDHHDDIARRGSETACECVALARPGLGDDHGVWPEPARDPHRVVDRVPVDNNDLVDSGHPLGDVGQVQSLVARRDDDGHGGRLRRVRTRVVGRFRLEFVLEFGHFIVYRARSIPVVRVRHRSPLRMRSWSSSRYRHQTALRLPGSPNRTR